MGFAPKGISGARKIGAATLFATTGLADSALDLTFAPIYGFAANGTVNVSTVLIASASFNLAHMTPLNNGVNSRNLSIISYRGYGDNLEPSLAGNGLEGATTRSQG